MTNTDNTPTSLASVHAITSNLPQQIFAKLASRVRLHTDESGINIGLNYWTGLKFRPDTKGEGRLVVKCNQLTTIEAVAAWFAQRGQAAQATIIGTGGTRIMFLDGAAALLLPELVHGLVLGTIELPVGSAPIIGWSGVPASVHTMVAAPDEDENDAAEEPEEGQDGDDEEDTDGDDEDEDKPDDGS